MVLLLHGFPTSSALWREFVPLLAGRFRVIVPDLMGSGDSMPADGGPLDLGCPRAASVRLLTQLGVERFAAVGHGEGGGVAQLLALDGNRCRRPGVDRLRGVRCLAVERDPGSDNGSRDR